MWFWWMMFGFNMVVPILMILVGRMMWKHFPKEINDSFGYRTKRSMRSQESWEFAHQYCGKLWWKIGWILLILMALVHTLFVGRSRGETATFSVAAMLVQAGVMLLTIVPTERALKKRFETTESSGRQEI